MKDRDPAAEAPGYVIGSFDNGLVVLPLDEARWLAALNDALEQASTWGDLLQAIADNRDALSYLANQCDGELPNDDEPFDPDEVPDFAEGVWPRFPKATFDQLPPSVIRLGAIRATAFDGDLFEIDEERRPEVVAALVRSGLDCIEDDDLIERACGDWRYGL